LTTVITSFVTMACDGPECPNTATFPQTEEGEKQAFKDNIWLNSIRFIQTVDQRKLTYCSDECEIKATGQGVHNKKVIEAPVGPNAAQLAAEAAMRAQKATEALKSGQGKVTLG
jgi:hypothetical protein